MTVTSRRTGMILALCALGLLLQGCTMFDYYDDEQQLRLQQDRTRLRMQQRLQAMNTDNTRSTREIAALRADLRAFQESQRKLYGVIDELRQENHHRAREIEQLRSLLASLESRAAKSDGKWRTDMANFKGRLAKDQEKAMSKLTTNLAEELERNLSRMRQATAAQRAAQTQSYGEYTVQAGDTLSAIAQAFQVSIKSIQDANRLKGDVIRVGQKLKIPAK